MNRMIEIYSGSSDINQICLENKASSNIDKKIIFDNDYEMMKTTQILIIKRQTNEMVQR